MLPFKLKQEICLWVYYLQFIIKLSIQTNNLAKCIQLIHEAQKKRAYNDRVIQIEKGSFTPLVFSISGGMGREAQGLMKKIAERMELTSGQRYSDCMGFMRKRLRFELLKTTLIALRGYRGREGYNLEECNSQFDGMDLNLEPAP